MIFIFCWVALSALVGVVAMLRGRHGLGWTMLSILVSPIIALLALIALLRENRTSDEPPL
jgi:hypothetical protein